MAASQPSLPMQSCGRSVGVHLARLSDIPSSRVSLQSRQRLPLPRASCANAAGQFQGRSGNIGADNLRQAYCEKPLSSSFARAVG
jgi:hypothetical protein